MPVTAPAAEPVPSVEDFPQHIAALVADGKIPFPTDLPIAEAPALAEAVRRLRYDRLVRYIARAIASDFHGAGHRHGG
jgi:hypothetical protein